MFQSFVKNVTSRVSGLLPATITKWFSSPSSSNANGSAQNVDGTDSSTEDEAPETPITTQPPPKRMRYTSPGEFNHYTQADVRANFFFPLNTHTLTSEKEEVLNSPRALFKYVFFTKVKKLYTSMIFVVLFVEFSIINSKIESQNFAQEFLI